MPAFFRAIYAVALSVIVTWPLAGYAEVSFGDFDGGLALVEFAKTKKYVFIGREGNVVFSSDQIKVNGDGKVLSVYPFQNGLSMVNIKTGYDYKSGFIDRTGRWIIPPTLDNARSFERSNPAWAAAKKDGKWGFIDTVGRWVIEPKFDEALGFDGGFGQVRIGDRWGLVDRDGKLAAKPEHRTGDTGIIHEYIVGRTAVWVYEQQSRKYGLLRLYTGDWVIAPKFSEFFFIDNEVAIVREVRDGAGYYLWINADGNVLRKLRINGSGYLFRGFHDGIASAYVEDGGVQKFGLINQDGFWTMPPMATGRYFTLWAGDGLWIKRPNTGRSEGKSYYIDETGNLAIKVAFKSASLFGGGLALVEEDSTGEGYITKEGAWAISPKVLRENLARWFAEEDHAEQAEVGRAKEEEADRIKQEKARLAKFQKEEADRIKQEEDRLAKFLRQEKGHLAKFRKEIKEGEETNCGPVIEVKSALVKVYSPVSGYGNEHWVKRQEVFPEGYGCRFVNGHYQIPAEKR